MIFGFTGYCGAEVSANDRGDIAVFQCPYGMGVQTNIDDLRGIDQALCEGCVRLEESEEFNNV